MESVGKNVTRIINELQILTYAAETNRPEVMESALERIEAITSSMKAAPSQSQTAKL